MRIVAEAVSRDTTTPALRLRPASCRVLQWIRWRHLFLGLLLSSWNWRTARVTPARRKRMPRSSPRRFAAKSGILTPASLPNRLRKAMPAVVIFAENVHRPELMQRLGKEAGTFLRRRNVVESGPMEGQWVCESQVAWARSCHADAVRHCSREVPLGQKRLCVILDF